MSRLTAIWILSCGLLFIQSNAAKPRIEENAHKEIEQAFNSGKLVVLVVAPSKSGGEDDESEAYGDWADSLNGFAASVPADIKIIKLAAAKYKQEVEEPKIRKEFATVFLRDSTHSLLYDGMVVEAKVYKLGLAWLHQQADDKAMAAYGLREKPATLK
jgi:hypothetical protein